jgi:lysophospholipase L1-like esterase
MHPVDHAVEVYRFGLDGARVDFTEGRDYTVWKDGIARKAGGGIYDFATYQPTTPFTVSGSPRHPPLIFDRQVYVDYCTKGETAIVPGLAGGPVVGKIFAAGDSITAAAHTVGDVAYGDSRDGYVGLLSRYFQGSNLVESVSETGTSLAFLENSLASILAQSPAALITAFGMNDHMAGASGLTSFEQRLSAVVATTKAAGTRPILVGFFQKNPLWVDEDPAMTLAYNAAIAAVASTHSVPFVDIRAIFAGLAPKKGIYDLTGDNVHHPNNWGHRIYFSAILPHLLASDVSAASVPGYVSF